MTKHEAELLIENEPYEMIKWLTLNYDKEIGAVGVGRIEDQRVIVEELFFPDQEVTSATVHFTSEDWAPVIKAIAKKYGEEEAINKIKKINFYWHKHPTGSAKPSSTDEEHTFDAFMDEESKRKYFGFLQTCKKSYGTGDIEWEPRIEMRTPIKHTIENVNVITRDLLNVEGMCKKIIASRIKKIKPTAIVNKNVQWHNPRQDWADSWNGYNYNNKPKESIKTTSDNSTTITESEGADLRFDNGQVVLEVYNDYVPEVEDSITDGELNTLIKKRKTLKTIDTTKFILQPIKKGYKKLREQIIELYGEICDLHDDRVACATIGLNNNDIGVIEEEEGEQMTLYDHEINSFKKANQSILADDYNDKQTELAKITKNTIVG